MLSNSFTFQLIHTDAGSAARHSTFFTPHGSVDMPAFMPVATQGSVKGLEIDQIRATGAQMLLGNTYHLALHPAKIRFPPWAGCIVSWVGMDQY